MQILLCEMLCALLLVRGIVFKYLRGRCSLSVAK